ncbi:MAG: Hpt domain-containing protein [Planctomycetota bacterium]|jgi:HPt (histidine-containing phosphotransfer) domain-containing protein
MNDVLDKAALLERIDEDMEFLAETVEMFTEDGPQLLSEIRDAVARQDGAALATSAHTFKGMAANFSAIAAVDAALALEMMGKNSDLTGAREALGALEKEAYRLKSALTELLEGE